MNVVEDRNESLQEKQLEGNEDQQFLNNLGGGATHLIGNKTLDVIHYRMNHESISTLISSHLAR